MDATASENNYEDEHRAFKGKKEERIVRGVEKKEVEGGETVRGHEVDC
jgi:hypothetical protein